MRRILFAVLLLGATGGTAESAHVLWFPFDHYVNMTCGFGCYTDPSHHDGVDFACPEGTDLYAAISGTVISVTNNVPGQLCSPMNFGNYVKIQNDQGDMQTIHGHLLMGSIVVGVGQHVNADQYLGESSNSGSTYNSQSECGQGGGYHLHLETRVLISGVWTPVDPYTYDGGLWTEPLQYGTPYACELKAGSQSPSGTVDRYPGQTFTCTVQYWNRGNTTWDRVPPSGYVELKAVHQDGTLEPNSVLYDSSWLNGESPCTMQESSVAPGQLATFTFTGRVSESATPGMNYGWFRPNHSDATPSLLSDWGGLSFNINVVLSTPTDPAPAPDALVAIQRSSTVREWQVCASNGSNGFGSPALLVSDFGDPGQPVYVCDVNNDGFDDLLNVKTVNSTTMEWRLVLSNGSGGVISKGVIMSDFGNANSYFVVGDFNGDGKDDLAGGTPGTDPTQVTWRVALSTGNTLVSDGVWANDFGNDGFRFFAGDVNGDGKCDLMNNNDGTNVTWRYALSTGHSFGSSTTGRSTPRSTPQLFQVGDYTGDGKCDIAYSTRTAPDVIAWSVCVSTGSTFGAPTTWATNFGDDPSQYFSRDMNRNGRCDLVAATPQSATQVEWRVVSSNGSAFGTSTVWRSDFGDEGQLFLVGNLVPTPQSRMVPDEPDDANRTLPAELVRIVPNPTHGQVQLWLDEPRIAVTSLHVFDLQGRLVRSITDPSSLEGNPLWWDGRNGQDERVPAGIYFLRITTVGQSLTRRVTVIR